MIDVAADGEPYQVVHLNGAAIAQVFVYPPSLHVEQMRPILQTRYLFRNRPKKCTTRRIDRYLNTLSAREITSSGIIRPIFAAVAGLT